MMEQVIVQKQKDGTYIADRPHLPGAYIIGRGNTWLEALGDLLIQDIRRFGVTAIVRDQDGKPVPPEFFGKNYQRD